MQSCSQIFHHVIGNAVHLGTLTFLCIPNTLAKICATAGSIFLGKTFECINDCAKKGLYADEGGQIGNFFPRIYLLIYSMIQLCDHSSKKHVDTKLSWGNVLQEVLFGKADWLASLGPHACTRQVASRLAFFGTALLITIIKIAQLVLALLGAVFMLLTFGGGCGSPHLMKVHEFVISNLSALDMVDTLCNGLRYSVHPNQYSSNALVFF